MMVSDTVKELILQRGVTQAWVVERMNLLCPSIHMDRVKFSAVVCGTRKMSADELLAFCKALEQSPDVFIKAS